MTTVKIYTDGDHTECIVTGATWAICRADVGGTIDSASISYQSGVLTGPFRAHRQILWFDTSSIFGTIKSVKVGFHCHAESGGGSIGVILYPGTPSKPAINTDFDITKFSGPFSAGVSMTDVDDFVEITLTDHSIINKGGTTVLALLNETYDWDNVQAPGLKHVTHYTGNHGTEALRPYLEIEYVPGIGYPREMHIKFDNGTGTITFRQDDSNRVLDYEFQRDENFPKHLIVAIDNADPTAAINLLNSSCALWSSGTAALKLGDKVRFGLYQSDGSTVDVQYDGKITNIESTGTGVIIVESFCYLKRAEYTKPTFTHGSNYRDLLVLDVNQADGRRYIDGVTDSSIVTPIAEVQFAHTDIRTRMGGATQQPVTPALGLDAQDEYYAQAFTAEGDMVLGVTWHRQTIDMETALGLQDGTCVVEICKDNDNSPGEVLYTVQENIPDTGPLYVKVQTDFISSNEGVPVIRGQKYWVKITIDFPVGGAAPAFFVEPEDDGDYAIDKYLYNTGGGETFVANENLNFNIDQALYNTIEADKYNFVDADNKIYLDDATVIREENGTVPEGAGYYGNLYRGRVGYYYGVITKEQLCDRLIQANTGMNAETDSNLDRIFEVYSTRGKPILECLQEVCDVFETSGSWNGYQSVIASYLNGSVPTLQVNKRKKTSDPATHILSHGKDTVNDDEHMIIVGGVRLKRTNKLNYAKVTMVGKSRDGAPLVCTRSDEALSGSFFEQMSGMSETMVVTDENLHSLAEVDRAAYALLDAVERDVWEGSIRLSGQHEDMFDWNTSSPTFGSGNIITLNWSPLGISAAKFKVRGMVLRPVETEIFVSNIDPVLKNRLTEGWGRAGRGESFHSPVGLPSVIYGSSYAAATITTATLYMELCDSAGTALPGQYRRLCTKFSNTDYNLNVYHAEFEQGNGYSSTIGGVGQIKLYTARVGGAAAFTIDLTRTVDSITVDEEIDKFKTMMLIFEVLADIS